MTDTKKSIFQRLVLGEDVPVEEYTVERVSPTTHTIKEPIADTTTATTVEPTAPVAVDKPMTEFQRLVSAPAAVSTMSKSEASTNLSQEQQKPLAVADLYKNEAYQGTMRKYLKLYAGEAVDGLTNQEVADKYINRMRSWSAGNSMTVLNEVYDLSGASDEDKAIAGDAYKLFDSMGSIFGEQASWGDTFDGLYDYAYSTIVDPTNLAVILGGAGIATRFGTKGAGAAAKAIATKAATEATKKAVARKASAKVVQAEAAAASNMAFRKSMTAAASSGVLKKEATNKLIATTALDTATALGVDYAYQSGMIDTGAQEDYSAFQSGLTALGALGGGMIQGAMSGISKATKAVNLDVPVDILDKVNAAKAAGPSTPKAAAKVAAKNIAVNLDFALTTLISDPLKMTSTWEKKAARGGAKMGTGNFGDLTDDTDFWKYVLLGNKENGITGLAESLVSAGVTIPAKKDTDDGVMDFISNVIRQLPADYHKQMQDSFVNNLGASVANYKDLSPGQFGDMIAKKFKSYGQGLNVASQIRKLSNDYVTPTAGALLSQPKFIPSAATGAWNKMGYIQNLFLRAVTAHPATSMMNAKGHVAMAAMDDISDLVRATLHSGLGFFSASQKEQGKAIRKALVFKQTTYLNPATTKEAFDGILAAHPDLLNKMMRNQVSGADQAALGEDFYKQFGFKLEDTKFLKMGDKMVDAAQTIWLGKALDGYTKSMAFVPALDKNLRLKFGADVGLTEFYNRPDLLAKMQTQDYLDVMSNSYEDAMRMVMSLPSKSGKDANPLEKAGAFIESLSRVPFVGTVIPFGRFFNNTIRVMSDYTGVGGAARVITMAANGAKKGIFGGANLVNHNSRDTAELISRGVVGLTLMYTLAGKYAHNIAAGLKYNQDFDDEGNIVNRQYEYPENFLRAGAAIFHYWISDEEMPEELKADMAVALGPGQMTRQLSDQEKGLIGSTQAILDAINNPDESSMYLKKSMAAMYETFGLGYVSGMMRPIDPVNYAAAIYRGEDYEGPDRKQGIQALNNSIRYVDQIFAVISEAATGTAMGVPPGKRTAVRSGPIDLQPTQVIGRRTLPPLTTTEKVLTQVGKELYKADVYSPVPEANNAVNEVMAPILEYNMRLLDSSKTFKEAPLDKKQAMVNRALAASKKEALEALRGSIVVEDQHVASLFDITTKFNKKSVQEAMSMFRDSFGDKEVYDLTPDQLDILKTYLETKADYLKAD